jgi:two-component system, LytTR family, sensor kinase
LQRSPTGFWRLQVGGWFAFAAAMSIGRAGEFPRPVIAMVEWPFALLGFCTTLILARVFVRLGLGTDSSARMLSLIALVSYGGGMLWTASFHTYLHHVAIPLISVLSPDYAIPFRRGPVLDNTVYNTLTLLAWSTLYVGLSYRDALFEQQARALRAVAEARDAQLQMLAYQLNPHFLFNTLNSVRALIDEDRDRARLMVTELARFLRYALVDRPLHLARLSEEIDALRGYLAVELVRFEDRLEVRLEVEPAAADCLVPAFLLNPLVENALKHGVPASGGRPLRVLIDARLTSHGTLAIVVENSGRLGKPVVRPTAILDGDPALLNEHGGLGLRNVRSRLEHLFPGRHRFELEQAGDLVRVSMELPALDDERALQPTEA